MPSSRLPAVLLAAALAAAVPAQYVSDFEALTGSTTGTPLTGQDGFYNPVAGSSDWNVHTYAGNSLGIPANPGGGNQFIAGRSAGSAIYGRAQRNLNWSLTSPWYYRFDFCGNFNGTLPTTEYLGSFSFQPSGTAQNFNLLLQWGTNTATGTAFNIAVQYWDSAGTAAGIVTVPDAAFQNLSLLNWYRMEALFDFASNKLHSLRLTDLTTNTTSVFVPSGWYMLGGASPTGGVPTDFRFFAGGVNGGNIFAADNLFMAPSYYGIKDVGCPGSSGTPALNAFLNTSPQLGTTFLAEASNLVAPFAGLMLTGFSDTMYQSSPLPFELSNFGAPGCRMLVAPDSTTLVLGGSGSAVWPLAIPNNPVLAGTRFWNQFASLDAAANTLGLAFSNSVLGCIH